MEEAGIPEAPCGEMCIRLCVRKRTFLGVATDIWGLICHHSKTHPILSGMIAKLNEVTLFKVNFVAKR